MCFHHIFEEPHLGFFFFFVSELNRDMADSKSLRRASSTPTPFSGNLDDYIKSPPASMNNMEDCKCTVEEVRKVWISNFPTKALDASFTHRSHQRGTFAVCAHTTKMFKIFGVYETLKDATEAIRIACEDPELGSLYKKIMDFYVLNLRLGPITFPFPQEMTGMNIERHKNDPNAKIWEHHHFDINTSSETIKKRIMQDVKCIKK